MKETAWIIGASTGLGRQLTELLSTKGISVVLSSRNERDLNALCSHIKNKYDGTASAFLLDLDEITDIARSEACIDKLLELHSMPSACYFLAGTIDEKDKGLQAAIFLNALLQQNFTGPVFLINELLKRKTVDSLRVVVASSVTASRARGKNIAYGTAKRALEQYCYGLMHALGATNTTIHIYRFGYLDTNLSYGQKLPFPAASPQKIAQQVIEDAGKGSGMFYRPRFWWFISFALNIIPFSIYKKLKF